MPTQLRVSHRMRCFLLLFLLSPQASPFFLPPPTVSPTFSSSFSPSFSPSQRSPHVHTVLWGRAAAVRAKAKGKTDGLKTKTYSTYGKKIIQAVKVGGSSSPDANPQLRDVINAAKKSSVPAYNIKRAIERASSMDAVSPKDSLFECYAAGGCSLVISVLTDNPNRAVAEIKNVVNNKFNRIGAKMAESGSVTYLYDRVAKITFPKDTVTEVREPQQERRASAEIGGLCERFRA